MFFVTIGFTAIFAAIYILINIVLSIRRDHNRLHSDDKKDGALAFNDSTSTISGSKSSASSGGYSSYEDNNLEIVIFRSPSVNPDFIGKSRVAGAV